MKRHFFAVFFLILRIFVHMIRLMTSLRSVSLLMALLLGLAACAPDGVRPPQDDLSPEVTARIEEANRQLAVQRFDTAMEAALDALALARREGSVLGEVQALSAVVGIDILSSRDADAWEKALEAEAIARAHGFQKELSAILIAKAKICSYAEISPETGRNDEGLAYAQEALALAEQVDAHEEEAEACYVIGSLYINKNRWNEPVDPELYRTAGRWLDRGQALADTYDYPRLRRNGILFRSRWFQQGGRNEEAIRYFEQVRKGLGEADYLTASALDDRLVRLYVRTGEADKALDAHDDYVFRMQRYIQQKQDQTLQEMETRFEVEATERQLERSRYRTGILALALLLIASLLVMAINHLRNVRRRAAELQRVSDSKEQIIEVLSRDLRNPANDLAGEITRLSAEAAALPPEAIREKCQSLVAKAKTMNTGVADYVGEVLIERSRRIADMGLSQREIQIIRLSAEGLKASEIAERIFLSVHTVNTHRQRIYAKMEVRNVSEMLRKARDLGIIV